jgi:hypothetical protein
MIIKRIEPFPCAKLAGTLYAILGFLIGIIFSLFALGGAGMMGALPFGGAMFGIGAIIILPLVYGCIGFVAVLIMASVYNLAAKWVGGLEIQVE